MESTLTRNQKRTLGPKVYKEDGRTYRIKAKVRFDDECGNGHNTFSITADIDEKCRNGRWRESGGGCCHDEVRKRFPELHHLVTWHLVSADGPMHYKANAAYWAGFNTRWNRGEPNDPPNYKHLCSTIAFGTALSDRRIPNDVSFGEWLDMRLASLLREFRADVEAFGFTW
jgi:hypothetical protein